MRFGGATLSMYVGACLASQIRTSVGFVLPNGARMASRSSGVMTTQQNLMGYRTNHHNHGGFRLFSSSEEEMEKLRAKMAQEAMMNPDMMKASAEQMKNMKPEDMDRMLEEIELMGEAERNQLKSMGMDVDMMKKSMKLMRQNPELIKNAQKMMEKLTPEQMVEQSKIAQQQMQTMTEDQVDKAAEALSSIPADQLNQASQTLVDNLQQQKTSTTITGKADATNPNVLDAMFQVGQLMSQPPTGGVTFKAFASLPPIRTLTGDRQEDLAPKELAECWNDGSLGSSRVDRAGFERVWNEVREWFEEDIMEESRKTLHGKAGSVAPTPAPASAPAPSNPVVGQSLTAEQLSTVNDQVKNLSPTDMDQMLSQMQNMTPEQEARMKQMGVDPAMMKRVSGMMKDNPMMRNAAQAMMKNMTPEQMVKASQQAQQQMKNMSPDQMDQALKNLGQNKPK